MDELYEGEAQRRWKERMNAYYCGNRFALRLDRILNLLFRNSSSNGSHQPITDQPSICKSQAPWMFPAIIKELADARETIRLGIHLCCVY
jgi:hypothetical protein